MATRTVPVQAAQSVTARAVVVSAAFDGAGDAVTSASATTLVRVGNFASPKWPLEYRVGSGPWTAIQPRRAVDLEIDLATVSLALRRTANAPATMVADVEFTAAASSYSADPDAGLPTTFGTAALAPVLMTVADATLSAARDNYTAAQAALNAAAAAGGGRVVLAGTGDVMMIGTLVVPSDTTLEIPAGMRLRSAQHLAGSNLPMIVNRSWQSPKVTVTNGITDAATSPVLVGRRLATADCGANAHGLTVGRYALIKGDTTKRYLGIYRVESVLDAFRFTFYAVGTPSGIGASAGTVTVQEADANITITGGGVLDYDGKANQTTYGYNAMLCVLNKVRGLRVQNLTMLDAPKYVVYWSNLQDATFSDLVIDGPSAAIQGIGLGLDISITRIKGRTNDDNIAWTGANEDYPEFNVPNGDLTGELRGFKVLDCAFRDCHANVVGLYPTGTSGVESLSGVVIDGLNCITSPGRYVYVDGSASISSTVADVAVRNLTGAPPSDAVLKVGGVVGGMTMRRLHLSDIDIGGGSLTVPLLATGNGITISKIDFAPRARLSYDSTAAQRYVVQLSNSSTFPDVIVEQVALTNATGGSGSYLLSGNFTGRTVAVRACEFFGTAAVLTGAPTSTTLVVENCYFDTFRACDLIAALTLFFRNNRFNAPSGPCLLAYGSGFTARIHAHGNFWGTAGTWLQIGASAGDTLLCEVWQAGNRAAGGYGTSINFTATGGGNYLRQSDATLPMDATKWTAIDSGCVFQNSNAAFGSGVGIYVRGTSTSARLVA